MTGLDEQQVGGRLAPGAGPRDGRGAEAAALRLAGRIAADGLADVTYSTVDSPFGPLLAASTRRGLVRLAFPEEPVDVVLEGLAHVLSPAIVQAPAPPEALSRELDAYFSGRLREFALDLDWALATPFARRVLAAARAIPYGSVLTYERVAAEAGSPRGARAAGNSLAANPIPIVVPCHRVLRATGALGGYAGGAERKRRLLELEGAVGPAPAGGLRAGGGG